MLFKGSLWVRVRIWSMGVVVYGWRIKGVDVWRKVSMNLCGVAFRTVERTKDRG